MQIDWFTVVAQILNFLILVGLLRRFLYQPILNAIDAREKKIASQLEEAASKKEEAEKEKELFLHKNEDFDRAKMELMKKAHDDSEQKRLQLLEEARNEASTMRTQLVKTTMEAHHSLKQEIQEKVHREVFAITQKMLSDLASMDLEDQTIKVFLGRLKTLNEAEKRQFLEAFQSSSTPILVRSAFDLPEKKREEIEQTVSQVIGVQAHFLFKTVPELVSGIELTTKGYKLAWSIAEYLHALEKNIAETAIEKSKTVFDKT
ncbi:hypothetical protein P872_18905 [Rhodonellum psychrophilum GCM71 = DSM 17998]|uniref:ATP synthase subunit b n=2 Tax=Rhodonellum TaxID=336827 RepID=U5BXG0_9BACT|nr:MULTISPECIES: hypothetical protein [Rhodonellum]ERM82254.1 hypothetical protein P872_18905 [Rhodonellum psychrophilum GCM71 = DSM 17998]SDZ25808.1 ATP synthase F0 subcomplex B subunit [Rhodonellum ikkaensis]